jgi:hypothetical protein
VTNSQASRRAVLEVVAEREVAEHLEHRGVRAVEPTSSRSVSLPPARRHFCTVVKRGAGGCFAPEKYGFSGCMPAEMKSVDGSSGGGISGNDGKRRWPARLEEREEALAELGRRAHPRSYPEVLFPIPRREGLSARRIEAPAAFCPRATHPVAARSVDAGEQNVVYASGRGKATRDRRQPRMRTT